MNLEPKHLGDELTLDEYNACQYLLYSMDCWNENVILDTYSAYGRNGETKYAMYKLVDSNKILTTEKGETYRINAKLTDSNNNLSIYMYDINGNFDKLNIVPFLKIYYQAPKEYQDGNNQSWKPDVTDDLEIDLWGSDEAKASEQLEAATTHTDLEKQYSHFFVSGVFDKKTRKINFKLPTDLPQDSIINKRIVINFKFNNEPYVDFRNGIANTSEEIWVDTVEDLERLVSAVPKKEEPTVFRLDSNVELFKPKNSRYTEKIGTYILSSPLIIKKGQNIIIRGGTNNRSRINGSKSKRCFIVKPGGKLTLSNIICEYGYANISDYDMGRGGAILVEGNYSDFGTLECNHCAFVHNRANHGGAIFCYHTGLFLTNCAFDSNEALFNGGAVYYHAQDVTIQVSNVVGKVGELVTLKAVVKHLNGVGANEGKVEFYRRNTNYDLKLGEARCEKGIAELHYTIPTIDRTTEYPIIAVYSGGQSMDNEIGTGSLKVKVPMKYTLSWASGNPTKAKKDETIHLNVKVTDINKAVSTDPTVLFTIGDEQIYANQNGNLYELIYKVDEEDITDETKNTIEIKCSTLPSTEYVSNTIKTTITVDTTAAADTGYITGLFINSNSISSITESVAKTKLETYKSKGITDLYISFTNYNTASLRKMMECFVKARDNNKITGIRIHARMNVLFDASNNKTYSPTDSTRLSFIKKNIDYVAKNLNIDGISLDYVRYSGDGKDNSRHPKITALYKTLKEYIDSKKKNYIISTCCKAEDEDSYTYYGQKHGDFAQYVDYMMPMVYKTTYATSKVTTDDNWVVARINYILNQKVDKNKIVVALQTYKSDNSNRTLAELTTTAQKISTTKVRGVALFREGLVQGDYVKSYKDIMEGK